MDLENKAREFLEIRKYYSRGYKDYSRLFVNYADRYI